MVLEHIRSDECIEERGYLEKQEKISLSVCFFYEDKKLKRSWRLFSLSPSLSFALHFITLYYNLTGRPISIAHSCASSL